ncbi:MAG: nitroreductase family protein [Nitrospirae bacterium]|nr:nitroreductase family protein [Nitrospirota bacterium]
MIEQLIKENRSCRRFYEEELISEDNLRWFIDLARNSASAANLQPIKYMYSFDPKKNEAIFSTLAWAGYLKEWPGPQKGERPSAYIIMLGDTEISKNFAIDQGIYSQSIMLGVREKGYGGCIIASVMRDQLRKNLSIPERYDILLVLALGKPKEKVVITEIPPSGDIKYWRDEDGVHYVPKRRLEDIIIK